MMNDEGQHDDQGQNRTALRGEWFAEQLGPRWRSSGDGIYRFAANSPPDFDRFPSNPARRATGDHADERT